MKIALLGYGKMGKTIEKIATERGHTIILKVDKDDNDYDLSEVDVAIDFSIPSAAVQNITNCFNTNTPVISGTTGWLDQYENMVALCNEKKGAFIYASNYSLGVNLFFELNKKLAKMMNPLDTYGITMEEIHHTQKLDAPSGTAITLAEGIIENSNKSAWELDNGNANGNTIPITAKRIENVPGTHTVSYTSEVDDIEIKHTAHNRNGFALGAVVAAEWIKDKTGVFNMKDVLGL
ncbi:4-hydroxy-tetrahydrodipicolinate reductase [Aquimarina sp. AD10]|uniref:4-hydroxy-tetrahydrodipicolinate reductase n=1 Tax=Aquimarina aggregata TaxID=1642818 RepID=A0A162X8J5_9FLAO|nr:MULTISPECIES: 4-hydroxy-tetrahydrodipicolinate reductase [Aquimarina]AXT60450.1 4-hydroxy-tetrahydrodipicolinate reductase [Aquimarina sp. AD10]KZS38486.1 4-hydroxy-tetrahydrodipicolinate reductase [Aquimarina aggregata]RKM96935.1 4-hydroxy-tetrahydrodipicolinate reductase [Aquimarina sp. AD10]